MSPPAEGDVVDKIAVTVKRAIPLLTSAGITVFGPCMPVSRTGLAIPMLNRLNDYGPPLRICLSRRTSRRRSIAAQRYYCNHTRYRFHRSELHLMAWAADGVMRYIDRHYMADNLPDLWALAAFVARTRQYADFTQLVSKPTISRRT